MLRFAISFVCLICFSACQAAERLLTLSNDDEIPTHIYPADGNTVLLWLPAEFGIGQRQFPVAEALAARGIEVWMPDFHSAWFLPIGRNSFDEVQPDTVRELIEKILHESNKKLIILAAGRSVPLAMQAIRQWQIQAENNQRLLGLIALNPMLSEDSVAAGEAIHFRSITSASNVPLYVLQPERFGGFWYSRELLQELYKSGAPVYLHWLPDGASGFYVRPLEEAEPEDLHYTERLPDLVLQSIRVFSWYDGTPNTVTSADLSSSKNSTAKRTELLSESSSRPQAPALSLPSLNGKDINLADHQQQVVLVNFWATWCPPCVEEIPSLQQLYSRFQDKGFQVLAVSVGESKQKVQTFMQQHPVNFNVLLDQQGELYRNWKVGAFPTSFVLDKQHRIRYAVFGAFDWNSDEVAAKIEALLAEQAQSTTSNFILPD
ncbi:MAG: hypothetical protein DRP64_20600 [Verrucomicrobia bacterium]|nr:MAG: hypothetical protein DRP64_20600 [Verrucomicrobiota bacterium]